MDSMVTREEAAARWRLDLADAAADSRQAWPGAITARMSEFERLTLVTEILLPVCNDLVPETGETDRTAQQKGDDGGDIDQDEETEEPGVNHDYSVILAAAAACTRWLEEDLGPALRAGGQDFETPMTLPPAADIDHWARERAQPITAEPSGDDIEGWLRWVDLRTARALPAEGAPREEWSLAVGHSLALVREAVHRLTLGRLNMRAGAPSVPETSVAAQLTENVYRTVAWLASTLQGLPQGRTDIRSSPALALGIPLPTTGYLRNQGTHSTDAIVTESFGTRGRWTWLQPFEFWWPATLSAIPSLIDSQGRSPGAARESRAWSLTGLAPFLARPFLREAQPTGQH